MSTRTRMSVAARRAQLLQIGVELLSAHSYEDVWVETVAERAGVSRGLMYHYFPTKRDFVAAVVREESDRLLDLIATEPQLTVPEQLSAGLDAYLAYVQEHKDAYRVLHAGSLTHDEEVRKIIKDALGVQEERILAALTGAPEQSVQAPSALLRTAVRAWLAFTIAVCLEWLEDSAMTREQVRDLCARTLLGAIAATQT